MEKSVGTITSEAKLPILLTPLPGPKAREVIARDAQFVSPSYTRGYPLVAKSGRGAIVEDVDGNVFLDFAAGIAVVSTGHCHPRVVEAIQKQAAELIHISCTDFYYQGLVELGRTARRRGSRQRGEESLFRQLGHGSHRSGHQAGAIPHAPRQDHRVSWLLSRAHARRAFAHRVQGRAAQGIWRAAGRRISHSLSEFLSLPVRQSFALHLRRIGDVSGTRNFQAPGRSRGSGGDFHRADSRAKADTFPRPRNSSSSCSAFAGSTEFFSCATKCRAAWDARGSGGPVTTPESSRTFLCVAKGIASGMPLSATIARASLMDWKPGAHASTFGGNPVCVAAALATMDLLETQYIENARRVGGFLLGRMADWPARHRIVGDVRGKGLMIGVEIVRDQKTKERAGDLREAIVDLAFEKGPALARRRRKYNPHRPALGHR